MHLFAGWAQELTTSILHGPGLHAQREPEIRSSQTFYAGLKGMLVHGNTSIATVYTFGLSVAFERAPRIFCRPLYFRMYWQLEYKQCVND